MCQSQLNKIFGFLDFLRKNVVSHTIYTVMTHSINYSYKFRLYPTETQKVLLAKHFGCVRFLYNHFLSERKDAYLKDKTSLNYYDNAASLTTLKKDLVWLKEVGSQSLQFGLKCLDGAYNNFFKGLGKFPVFKSKFGKQSFRVPQSIQILEQKLRIPKFLEGIKMRKHREVEGDIKFATISKNNSGQYFVSITVERDISSLPQNDNVVGIDLGIKTLATCSDGVSYDNIRAFKKLRRKLKIVQRRHSKKEKGSNNRSKAKLKVARLHQKIKNIRENHLHQTTRKIINKNQVIILENLNIKGMMQNRCLAQAIQDVSLSEFNRQLEYKAAWYHRTIHRLSRWFPSSKTCSDCGWINQNLKLSDREWECQSCGVVHDRDYNASLMILHQGKSELRLPLE